jgi:iron complex transport system permease protein
VKRRAVPVLGLMAACAAGAAVLAVCLGPARVPLHDVASLLSLGGGPVSDVSRRIILDVRLPRIVMGACVGALLGCAGALLQGFLRNPLAEPYVLGISSGAGLAVTVAITLNLPLVVAGVYLIPPLAFGGALAALLAVYMLAAARGRLMVTTLILAGVVMSAFLSALVMLFATLSTARYFEVTFWLMGHLQPVTKSMEAWTAGYAILGVLLSWSQARDLNALMLGEEEAATLGVKVESLKRNMFILTSLMVGAAVSVSGMIGFVGLVAPHVCRLLLGPDHRLLIPASALGGATLLLLADLAARLAFAPAELPVGVVTALVGGPFFLYLLARHAREIYGRNR